MGAIANDVGAQSLNIFAAPPKTFRPRRHPHQLSARFQYRVGPDPYVTANCVKHHVADWAYSSKIIQVVVDYSISTEATHVRMIAGARRGDHPCTVMLCELH